MRRANDPTPQPAAWDPDEHWERGHRELRKHRVKQAVPYVVVAIGIVVLLFFAWSNEPEVESEEGPSSVPVEDSSLLPPGVTTPTSLPPGGGLDSLPVETGPDIQPIPVPPPTIGTPGVPSTPPADLLGRRARPPFAAP